MRRCAWLAASLLALVGAAHGVSPKESLQ